MESAGKEVLLEDVMHSISSFGVKDVHMKEAVKAISSEERNLLSSGILYKIAKEKLSISYTIFYERLETF